MPRVGIVMGSASDWEVMREAARQLADFSVPFESKVLSAHRTPDALEEFVSDAEARGAQVFVAAAGGPELVRRSLTVDRLARLVADELGQDLETVADEEADMGLGNGGLGRLAACFLDSLATMDIPAIGYGIHYEFGLFRQTFVQGRQVEVADNWLANNNPCQRLHHVLDHSAAPDTDLAAPGLVLEL